MINVTKRNGALEALDLEKIHQILFFACEGISGVSVSAIEMRSQIQFFEGISTETIHDILIKACSGLISEEAPNYQYVAGRLVNYSLRKKVYGQYTPSPFVDIVQKLVKSGVYDSEILTGYTTNELEELGKYIKHKRDDKFTYAAMEQWRGKYLVQNRVTKEIYETPQIAYMMIASTLFMSYSKDIRIKTVKKFYDSISTFDISLPTPIMAGVRTPTRQFSSCVTLNVGDSLDSIAASNHAVIRYVSRKAGIGINYGRVRARGSKIRDGEAVHTGLIPFLKSTEASVKSCSQGAVRNGAATVYFPLWHLEFENLLVLKNNKGTDEQRVRKMDYAWQFNEFLYQRLIDSGNITFFSPDEVPGLYDAFCQDQKKFAELYVKYENDPSIRKETRPALEVFAAYMQERQETGRIYLQNIDHANTHSPFIETVAPIEQSNLCCEICLNTVPFDDINGDDGLISLCTLAAINWGNFTKPEDMQESCEMAIRALDALLDYQDYPVNAAKRSTDLYRPLGVGIINLAYFLAKRGLRYDTDALSTINEWTEAWSYYLLEASVKLAKEKGRCEGFDNLKYSKGILPIDTYKKDVDTLVQAELKMPWDSLRNEIALHGIRNATVMACMPAETSAQISNSTSGIEPVRSLVTVKISKDGVLPQVVPEIEKLKNKYTLLWEQKDNKGYLDICAVLQKYIDQGISVNTNYNPVNYPDGKVPMSVLIQDMLTFYKFGGKQLYYSNTFDSAGEGNAEEPEEKAGLVLPDMPDEADCDSCVL